MRWRWQRSVFWYQVDKTLSVIDVTSIQQEKVTAANLDIGKILSNRATLD